MSYIRKFSEAVEVPDEAFGGGWNGSLQVPTKNAIFAKLGSLALNDLSGTLPINKGGTGQTSAANAFAALSPLTTKGDISGYSTAPTRVPVGADGQILIADSTQARGLRWTVRRSKAVRADTKAADLTPDIDNYDIDILTEQDTNLTVNNPTGTPQTGQMLEIIITSNGIGGDTLTFDSLYAGSAAVPMPSATPSGGQTMILIFMFYSGIWHLLNFQEY